MTSIFFVDLKLKWLAAVTCSYREDRVWWPVKQGIRVHLKVFGGQIVKGQRVEPLKHGVLNLVKKSMAQLRRGPIDDQLGHSILPNSVSRQENGPENKKTCQQSSKVVKLEGLMGEYWQSRLRTTVVSTGYLWAVSVETCLHNISVGVQSIS